MKKNEKPTIQMVPIVYFVIFAKTFLVFLESCWMFFNWEMFQRLFSVVIGPVFFQSRQFYQQQRFVFLWVKKVVHLEKSKIALRIVESPRIESHSIATSMQKATTTIFKKYMANRCLFLLKKNVKEFNGKNVDKIKRWLEHI